MSALEMPNKTVHFNGLIIIFYIIIKKIIINK